MTPATNGGRLPVDLDHILGDLRSGGPERWQPYRLILHNFWRFDDQVFHFVHGRLILSGANGSGKSTALSAAITLVLDANRRQDRLTLGKGSQRDITYYIVGHPKEHYHYPDGRTSYIALEFYHPAKDEYRTTAIGLNARGQHGGRVKMWGFVLDDGRRIGHDVHLYSVRDGQKETYAKPHLKRVLGDNIALVEKNQDYQGLVNDTLFGYETAEAYRELLDLMQRVRTPGLGEQVDVDGICDILSSSLPPMDQRYVDRLSGILDDIETTKEQLDEIEVHLAALEEINKRQERFKELVAQRQAAIYQNAAREERDQRKRVEALGTKLAERKEELREVRERLHALGAELTSLEGEIDRLRDRDVVQQHQDLNRVEDELETARVREQRADRRVEQANKDLKRARREHKAIVDRWSEHHAPLPTSLEKLAGAADELAWPQAAERFSAAGDRVADLTLEGDGGERFARRVAGPLLDEEVNGFRHVLRAVRKRLGDLREAEQRHRQAEGAARRERTKRNEAHDEYRSAREARQDAREDLLDAWRAWQERVEQIALSEAEVGLVTNHIHRASSAAEVGAIPSLVAEPADRVRTEFHEERSGLEARRKRLTAEIEELEGELEEIRARSHIAPERGVWQNEARARLVSAEIPAVPLYEATDFREGVDEPTRAWVEQALVEAGLLDALVVPPGHQDRAAEVLSEAGLGDRFLRSTGPSSGRDDSLLRWLVPVEGELGEADVAAALSAVRLAGDGASRFELLTGWRAGPVEGRLPGELTRKIEPSFIGHAARVRRWKREVAALEGESERRQERREAIDEELATLEERLAALQREIIALRELPALNELSRALDAETHARRAYEAANERVEAEEAAVAEALSAVQELRRAVRVLWDECPGPTKEEVTRERIEDRLEAVNEIARQAADVARDLDTLLELREQHLARARDVDSRQKGLGAAREDIEDARKAITRLEGERNGLRRLLEASDVEEVLKRLREARQRHRSLREQTDQDREKVGGLETDVETQAERKRNAESVLEERIERRAETETHLKSALTAYPSLEEELKLFESEDEGPLAAANHLLRNRQTASFTTLVDYIDRDKSRKQTALIEAFKEHMTDLADYYPTFDADEVLARFRMDGSPCLPYVALEKIQELHRSQRQLLRQKDNELYQEFVLKQFSTESARRIRAGQDWVDTSNAMLDDLTVVNQRRFRLKWRPRHRHEYLGQQVRQFVEIMQKDPEVRTEKEADTVIGICRAVLNDLRRREKTGELDIGFTDAVKGVFDYRRWFEFTIEKRAPNDREWRNLSRTVNSGGEGTLSTLIPLFIAVKARYEHAAPDAPLLIGMDEALEKVDGENKRKIFSLLVDLGFSWVMTSEDLWGVGNDLPGCATYLFGRVHGELAPPVLHVWDGERRVGGPEATLAQLERRQRSLQLEAEQ